MLCGEGRSVNLLIVRSVNSLARTVGTGFGTSHESLRDRVVDLLALAAVRLFAITFFERATLAQAVAYRSAFLGAALEVVGLGIHCHGVEV